MLKIVPAAILGVDRTKFLNSEAYAPVQKMLALLGCQRQVAIRNMPGRDGLPDDLNRWLTVGWTRRSEDKRGRD